MTMVLVTQVVVHVLELGSLPVSIIQDSLIHDDTTWIIVRVNII